MDPDAVRRSLEWRAQLFRRRVRALLGAPTERRDLELQSAAGYPIAARITRPVGAGRLPGLLVSPAIHQGRDALDTGDSIVTADELARLGYAVLTHDPAGRGGSWGEEDFGGPEHQDDLRVAGEALQREGNVTGFGVLSLSYGVVAAVAALARWPEALPARWLVDWEGPSDREIITTGGTRLVPAAGHALDDEDYWQPREPIRHLAAVRCGYLRLQAWPDHAQGREIRHAERMVRAANMLPWWQLNDHPRNTLPPRPNWLPGGPWAANQTVLRRLADLRG